MWSGFFLLLFVCVCVCVYTFYLPEFNTLKHFCYKFLLSHFTRRKKGAKTQLTHKNTFTNSNTQWNAFSPNVFFCSVHMLLLFLSLTQSFVKLYCLRAVVSFEHRTVRKLWQYVKVRWDVKSKCNFVIFHPIFDQRFSQKDCTFHKINSNQFIITRIFAQLCYLC